MTNDGQNALVYDAKNRVLSATNGSASGTYTYDGNSLRVKKVSGSTTTIYIFSGSKVIAEYSGTSAPYPLAREYIYSGGALLAKIESGVTKYYHPDHLSNRVVTDSSGNTVAQLGHYPFAESWYNASSNKLLFTSYERDSESGNDYALARSYVNRLARFSSPDLVSGSPGIPQSLNKYSYALNDAGNLRDPLGLSPTPNPATSNFVCSETTTSYACWIFVWLSGGSEIPLIFRAPRDFSGDGGGLSDLLKASIARVQADLKKANCANDFKDANAAMSRASDVGFSDQGTPKFRTKDGQVTGTATLGKYNRFTGSINLNTSINWADPANTSATLDGKPYNFNALAAEPSFLAVPSMSAGQLMDITILHELSHLKGAIGNPDNPSVEKTLWNDCIN
jgi:RHS repeat-associated protein